MHSTRKPEPKREVRNDELQKFSDAVSTARARLEAPVRDDAEKPSNRNIWASLDLASSELLNAMEELSVAEEELRQQNEELLANTVSLEEERLRYLELFEFAPDAYLVTDLDGTIRQANKAAAKLLRVPMLRLAGKPLPLFVQESVRPVLRQRLVTLAAESAIESWVVSLQPRNGDPMVASISATTIIGPSGTATGYRWILRDVTEQIRLRDELAKLNEELENKVADRTAELRMASTINHELLLRERDARARAERANKTKADFFTVLSHEFRTPLQAIFGYTELLEREIHGPLRPEQARDLQRIQQNLQHLLGLINGILDFARVESGTVGEMNITRIPLTEVIGSMEGLVAPQLAARKIGLEVTTPDENQTALGDWARVQQILLNLLSNAIKFTPPGGHVAITHELTGACARINVRDTGCGIPYGMLDQVFEPFVQVRAPGQVVEGTGLGLAISRNLAQSMGGKILVQSTIGAGSVFTLELPSEHPV